MSSNVNVVTNINNALNTAYSPFSSHPSFNRMIYNWHFLRDAIEGEAAIKFKNELYLPMPTSMQLSGNEQVNPGEYYSQFFADDEIKALFHTFNPNYHTNPAYRSYITRARFPEITSHVLRGLVGLVLKEPVTYNLPTELEYLRERATPSGLTLNQLFVHCLYETLITGKELLVVDSSENDLFLAPYSAESNINWSFANSVGSDLKLRGLRLVEKAKDNFDEDQHTFSASNSPLFNAQKVVDLLYDERKGYHVKTYTKEEGGQFLTDKFTERKPTFMGRSYDGIPAFVLGSIDNSFRANPAPMLPISRCSQYIYMKSADLSQSEFLSCSPMLVISGASDGEKPSAIGSTVCLMLSNPEAKAEFTKTDTSALQHVRSHMKDLHEEAIQLGAQLLDVSGRPAETAETNRMRQGASTATLLSTLNSIIGGMEAALKTMAKMKGGDPNEVSIVANKDFLPMTVTAAEIRELVQAWMNDAISKQTLYKTFQDAGIAKEDITFEDEQKLIQEEYLEEGSPKAIRREAFITANRGVNKNTPTSTEKVDDNGNN